MLNLKVGTQSLVRMVTDPLTVVYQGRRRFSKSGTAIERHRRSAMTEGPSKGRAREGGFPLLVRGVGGDLP